MQVFKLSSQRLFVAVLLVFCLATERAQAQTTYVSWIFRGVAQQNNSVLTFNMGDTLSLVCKGKLSALGTSDNNFFFAITKGSVSPSCMVTTTPTFTVSGGTLVFDDMNGNQAGFENIVVIQQGPYYGRFFGNYLRPVSIGYLFPNDAGTYHCCGVSLNSDTSTYVNYNSGGLAIVVNTKPGQAGSTQANGNRFLAYSALLLSSAKLIF